MDESCDYAPSTAGAHRNDDSEHAGHIGECEECVFHAQIATDLAGDNIRIVTVHAPDANEWDENFA